MRTMPSARDSFSISHFIEGQLQVQLYRKQPGALTRIGPPWKPFWAVDLVPEDEPVDLGMNAKAVTAAVLIAALFKDPAAKAVTHLAVGTGPGLYDPGSPPDVVANTILEAELFRTPLLFSNFVDSGGDPTLEQTNTVDLVFRFDFAEAVGTLEEMGLFGGTGASERNGGLITNYKTFTPFVKASDRVMYVTWRLRFNI